MDPKHSDNLFRERLGEYSQEPEPQVWDRIRTSLDRKKKRRIIPIWWYAGGAAALLALSLLVWYPQQSELPAVTDTESRPQTPEAAQPMSETPAGTAGPEDGQVADTEGTRRPDSDESLLPKNSQGMPEATAVATQQPSGSDHGGQGRATPSNENALAVASPVNEREITNNTDRDISEGAAAMPENTVVAANPPVEKSNRNRVDLASKTTEDVPAEDPAAATGKSIFEAIAEAEQEEVPTAEPAQGKWTLGPSVAPVYYNAFGEGSPISPNFSQNNKSGTVNMSYGVEVAYAVTPRLSVRSGVHRVDYGYNTNDVAFTSSFSAAPSSLIRTISYSENSKNLVVSSMAGDTQTGMVQNSVDVAGPSPEREGSMVQQFGYLEVPLELEYRIIDRRWGLNLIGGMSSLFLIDNAVRLDSNGTTTEIGQATNMNDLNFSTNLGLGLFYNLNTALQVRMQPVFKYHLNTFTDTSGSFQPYSVGIYSGLSFRF